ncbi:MAG TPA: DNA polymerase I [Gemmatimonadales bacterium]
MPAAPESVFLIDGYALIYRAFFALIARPLTTRRGENTSAAWGVTNFLLRLRERHHPAYLGWVNDVGESFRHRQYPEYKATREKLDESMQQDFDRSVERITQILDAFRVPVLGLEGYEADDVIGTLATQIAEQGRHAVIVSGDKDFYQLIGPRVSLLNPGRGGPAPVDEQWVDESNAHERLGVGPGQVIDYLALVGDASDNVPGVKGIGEKTAVELLTTYGDLDAILEHAADIPGKRAREALLAHLPEARLSRDLVTIRRNAPVAFDPATLATKAPDAARLTELFTELEFRSLIPKLGEAGTAGVAAPAAAPVARAGAPALVLDDPAALADVIAECRRAPRVAVDTETTSIDPRRADLVGMSLAVAPARSWYLPFAHVAPDGELAGGVAPRNLPPLRDPALAPLRELLTDPRVPKAGHNIKYDWIVLRRAGVELAGVAYDSMLASFVIDPGRRSHALDTLALELFGVTMRTFTELVGKGKSERPFAAVPLADAARYCCDDSEMVLRLYAAFEPQLDERTVRPLLDTIELPLVRVLVDMEWDGVLVDRALLAELSRQFTAELGILERQIYAAAGTAFNINSTPQLRTVLFEKLQLQPLKKTKTGASTDFEVLEQLAAQGHEVPRLLIEYRELSKLKSTYVDALPAYINPETGRVHTSYNQTGAATGRLSSTEPNLQNIPVRTLRGESIRKAFIAPPGSVLCAADYSQIELRLLAHFSHDPAFVHAFEHGDDIHRQTAAIIFGVAQDAVTPEMRARAKTINFGTIYGQGPFGLSRQLGIPQDEAKKFITDYFARFARVRTWLDEMIAQARKIGYVETLFGRRRYIPEINDKNFNVKSFGERLAMNSPLQGSAADLIKKAMIDIAAALSAERLRTRMLLQVHDELVFEVPEREVEAATALVKHHMEAAHPLDVPLVVSVGVGKNWVAAKE